MLGIRTVTRRLQEKLQWLLQQFIRAAVVNASKQCHLSIIRVAEPGFNLSQRRSRNHPAHQLAACRQLTLRPPVAEAKASARSGNNVLLFLFAFHSENILHLFCTAVAPCTEQSDAEAYFFSVRRGKGPLPGNSSLVSFAEKRRIPMKYRASECNGIRSPCGEKVKETLIFRLYLPLPSGRPR